MNPIIIDLSGLKKQFGLASQTVEELTETCVNSVTAAIYLRWESLAKQNLHGTLPEYLQHLIKVDKGRFAKQIILTGVLPNMIEQGASAFDLKNGFAKSKSVKYTVPVYKNGKQVYAGGDWYLSIPFRIGVPGTLGQGGFSGEMPNEIYSLMVKRASKNSLGSSEIPDPYNKLGKRDTIFSNNGSVLYNEYQHKNSIYEGLYKKTAAYGKTTQNTYGTFRRAGANSDPMSWIHKGFVAKRLSEQAVSDTDVETIVENEVTNFLETIL